MQVRWHPVAASITFCIVMISSSCTPPGSSVTPSGDTDVPSGINLNVSPSNEGVDLVITSASPTPDPTTKTGIDLTVQ